MPVVFLLYLLLAVAQFSAFMAGIHLLIGGGALLSFLIMIVAMWLPLGSIAVAATGFYGACSAWDWPWWQAALLTFPFAVLGVFSMSVGAVAKIFEALVKK